MTAMAFILYICGIFFWFHPPAADGVATDTQIFTDKPFFIRVNLCICGILIFEIHRR